MPFTLCLFLRTAVVHRSRSQHFHLAHTNDEEKICIHTVDDADDDDNDNDNVVGNDEDDDDDGKKRAYSN